MDQTFEVNRGWGLASIEDLRGKGDRVDGPRRTLCVHNGRKFPAIAPEWKASTQSEVTKSVKR